MTTTARRVPRPGRSRHRSRGQSLVEFSLVLIPFLYLLMGCVDLGRGIYVNNAVAQAAREIARVTVTHPCPGSPCTSYSAETQAVIDTQLALVPGMTASSVAIACTDVAGDVIPTNSDGYCPPGEFYRVTVTVPFTVLTPLLPVPEDFSLGAVSHVQIP